MNDNTHIGKNAASLIEKYHKGQLSAKEMHELEKAALEDPFLADALEGYALPGVNAAADLKELQNRLAAKTQEAKLVSIAPATKKKTNWLRVAAAIVIVAGAGILAQKMLLSPKKSTEIAQQKENTNNTTEPLTRTDSVINNEGIATVNTTTTTATSENKEVAGKQTNSATAGNQVNAPATVSEPVTDLAKNEKPAAVPAVTTHAKKPAEEADKKLAEAENATGRTKTLPARDDVAKKNNAIQTKKDNDGDGVNDEIAANTQKPKADAGATAAGNQNRNRTQEPHVFQGRVTDANNVGLPYARIMNTADNNAGTYTDVKGYFTITYPDTTVIVQVRSVGFDNSNVALQSNLKNNQVTLKPDNNITAVVMGKKINADKRRSAPVSLTESEPMDGWDNYDTYIANNLDKPEEFKTKPSFSNGTVDVSFEVNKYGEPVNFKIEKSLCKKCDKEAIRLVKEGPKWRRNANKNGRTTVTISF